MSNINTASIATNYPNPGVNNSSQGFRDNFSAIKNSLDTAGTEIGELQGKVLLKSALTGSTLNNDMAGGQISNVLTLGFRKTTYQLGSNLNGIITIDCSKADVHYGTVTDDCKLDFSKWSPSETQGTVEVILTVTAGRKIALPDNVVYGQTTIEGYRSSNNSVIVPAGVTRIHWSFSSIDCGTSVEIQPIDTPRITRQIKWGAPTTNKGSVGDKQGAVMLDATYLYVCVADYTDGTANIWNRASLGTTGW
jgi:hypothetical protein